MTITQHPADTLLELEVRDAAGAATTVSVPVTEAYNFGYAGRDQASAQEHVDQMQKLGMPAPQRVPAIFPIPPSRVTTDSSLVVSGAETYGEVEFALIRSADHGWLVTIGSDHTDLEVERVKMPKAKGMCPDVVGATAWRLDDVRDSWDRFTLTIWGHTDDGDKVELQHDTTGHLLSPDDLIATLNSRRPGEPPVGTVIMSGTIGGEPTPGMAAWSARLEDPETQRRIEIHYTLNRLDEEI